MLIKLKLLRIKNGMTLEQLAQQSGLTRSYLSKIERGVSTPSIESALNIAKALGVSVEHLFGHQQAEAEPISITRAAEPAERSTSDAITMVAGLQSGRMMRAFIVQPSRKPSRGRLMSHHEGEELLYVLKGEIELQLSQKKERLLPGDCVHFDSWMPHRLLALTDAPCSALIVVASREDDLA